jgi:hypothetical protein
MVMSIIGKVVGWVGDEVEGVVETAVHAGKAIYDGATGDWDGAAEESGEMANSALNVATGGILGDVEDGVDAAGGDSHGFIHDTLKDAGEWLGDKAYELTHDDE